MERKEKIKAIIEHPEYMMTAERQSLQKRLENKNLDSEEVKSVVTTTTKDKGKSLVSDLLNTKWFDLVCDIADTGDKLKNNLDDAKKVKLLGEYLQKTDNHEKALKSLIDLITDPYGLALYSKIINILSDSPADGDILEILSDYLNNLTKEESLQKAFSRNKTILSLIDKSSPQALMLLRRANEWPEVTGIGAFMSSGGHIQGDYSRYTASSFISVQQFSSISIDDMQMAIVDLEKNGLANLVSGTISNGLSEKHVTLEQLTDLGKIVREAIIKK